MGWVAAVPAPASADEPPVGLRLHLALADEERLAVGGHQQDVAAVLRESVQRMACSKPG
jgi:hypothetical protein